MYNFYFNEVENSYEMREMVRMFLSVSSYQILDKDPWALESWPTSDILIRVPNGLKEKNSAKRFLYNSLSKYTGLKPDWGIMTGVRPVKLTGELITIHHSLETVKTILLKEYYLSETKADLLLDTWKTQQEVKMYDDNKAVGIYIGIPFCPTKCIYCSFPSYPVNTNRLRSYLEALRLEIAFVGQEIEKKGWYPESIYIGGGTPTTLSDSELEELLKQVHEFFNLDKIKEFTVEAGRPDTITQEKLKIISKYGVKRISINPQSMKEETLKRIGRFHKPEEIITAFNMAREFGFSFINMDLIAGLPGENTEDFIDSLQTILMLKPENITVHTLAVKRASKLKEMDMNYSFHQGKKVRKMIDKGSPILLRAGYRPYYLYRQKQMTGNFENVGYALPGTESIYNIKIMEENQTIIALGAGGISKAWYPKEKRLERIPNVSNYEIYIERIDEMIERKRKGIFV